MASTSFGTSTLFLMEAVEGILDLPPLEESLEGQKEDFRFSKPMKEMDVNEPVARLLREALTDFIKIL